MPYYDIINGHIVEAQQFLVWDDYNWPSGVRQKKTKATVKFFIGELEVCNEDWIIYHDGGFTTVCGDGVFQENYRELK